MKQCEVSLLFKIMKIYIKKFIRFPQMYKNYAVTAQSSQGLGTAPVRCHYNGLTIFKDSYKCRLLQNRRGYGDRSKP